LTEPTSIPQARRAVLTVVAVLALMAGWQFYRGRTTVAAVLASSAVVLFIVAWIPTGAAWFYRHWMRLAHTLGYVNSRILLSLTYYLMLTPIGLVKRLLGHDQMDRRGGRRASYWTVRRERRQSKEGFERAY
jgi:hypothetical protein